MLKSWLQAECTPNVYGNKLIYIFLRKIDGLWTKIDATCSRSWKINMLIPRKNWPFATGKADYICCYGQFRSYLLQDQEVRCTLPIHPLINWSSFRNTSTRRSFVSFYFDSGTFQNLSDYPSACAGRAQQLFRAIADFKATRSTQTCLSKSMATWQPCFMI